MHSGKELKKGKVQNVSLFGNYDFKTSLIEGSFDPWWEAVNNGALRLCHTETARTCSCARMQFFHVMRINRNADNAISSR